jgi:hypothetical protein
VLIGQTAGVKWEYRNGLVGMILPAGEGIVEIKL